MEHTVSNNESLMTKNESKRTGSGTDRDTKRKSTTSSKGGAKAKVDVKDKSKTESSKSVSSKSASSKSVSSNKLTDFEVALMDRTKSGGVGDSNKLVVDDIFRMLDLYFYRDFYAYRHLHNSYNKFIDETIPDFLMNNEHIFTEAITEQRVIRHKLEFKNVRADTPKMANEVDPLFPADARKLMQTYQLNIYADVTQFREVIDVNATGESKITKEKIGHTEEGMMVMTVPTMLRSKYCNLNAHPEEMTEECRYDPGGYFIIGGSEKVVITQDKMIPNHPMVFLKKGSNTSFHMVQVNSTSGELSNMMQTVSIRIKKDGVMVMKFPVLYEVNPVIVFRALGIESDADIAELCIYDRTDYHMMDLIRASLDNCYNDNREGSKIKIRTQEEAIDYLITKMRLVKRYTETNQAIKHEQKKIYLMELLKTSLLPHIKGTSDTPYREKALYLGYMINQLLKVELGREEVDNRDSYCNKRIANIDELLAEIMVQHYKGNMSECNKKFMDWMKDKLATEDPHNVIHHFKASVFEQGFKSALMQGNWPRAKGVSQMLNRISYMQLLSFLSRIDSQSTSKSSSKLTKPRLTDPSSTPFIDPTQTPEHAKVGLIKHLSMLGSLTIGDKDNTALVREYITSYPDVQRITDVKIHELKKMFKIFLNGEWIGMIRNHYDVNEGFMDNPSLRFYTLAKLKKIKGEFDPQMTSIVLDSDAGELRFNTDSGRLYRPVLRVTGDNELVLTKEMIDRISLKPENTDKITVWDDFYTMEEYPIEFIDSEEQPYSMIAPMIKDLNREREKIIASRDYKFSGREDKVTNRYNDNFFVRYDYCEIHPSVLLGEIATNIPFPNRNQGPRNIFQYAQGRQGMGIYNTVYRSRTDISYILYHPETPIVNTRTSKYTYTDVLGPGSNAVVAIATYGSYNQEDSLIFNMTSLQRALFRSMSLKKYVSQITKNQETSANDKFMKPAPDKTLGMKYGNYEKLNMEGYAPEETKLTNGDMIFGKVTPITDMPDSDKIFKDDSEQFKEKSDGVVDRVYIGIHNQEGQEVRRALVRMERMPMIGDKFCCYDPSHDVLTTDGWVPVNEITLEHKVASLVNGKTLKYVKPTAIQSYDYNGDMYVVDTNQVSLKVTPNHRMYVGDRSGKVYKIELAQDIKGKRRTYMKNCENIDVGNDIPDELEVDENGDVKYFVLKKTVKVRTTATKAATKAKGTKSVVSKVKAMEDRIVVSKRFNINSWVRFFGVWIAEGCVTQNWNARQVRIAAHKQRVKDILDEVCADMDIDIIKNAEKPEDKVKNSWRISDEDITSYLDPLSNNALDKHLPKWVWYLTKEQAQKLVDGMMLGDGHIMKGTVTMRYDTSSKQLRDDFQRLVLHAGYSANWSLKYKAGKESIVKTRYGKELDEPEIITSTVDSYRLTIVTKQNNPLANKNANAAAGTGYSDCYEQYNGKVYCCTVPGDGIIYVRRNGLTVWCGQSRHGQKGTMGIGMKASDMPHTKNGIRPDIIMNPNAIPSRMTIGQFWEQLMAKVGALLGINMDATAFEDYDIEEIKEMLRSMGYNETGEEYLYNGMSGQRMKTSIFIAPCYYQRLKHMVYDKVHSRARGSTTILVRQAAEGRSRDGGLRMGEMERDALIAHGMSKFILDKMLYNSDVYSTYVCGICGLFAIREVTRNSSNKPHPNDIYKCPMCKNYHDIHKIVIPYAFKLMIQELMAMNILARIRVKKSDRKIIRTE